MNARMKGYFALSGALALLLAACGGGSGGGGGIDYGGVTTPASVTTESAGDFVASVSGGSSGVAAAGGFLLKPDDKSGNTRAGSPAIRAVMPLVRDALGWRPTAARKGNSAKPFSDSFPGEVAGTATISGDVDDSGLGHISMRFSGYDDGDGMLDGSATVDIVSVDLAAGFVEMQLDVPILRFADSTGDVSISGQVDAAVRLPSDRMTLVMNVDGRDNLTGASTRLEDFQADITFDSLAFLFPCEETMSLSGRLYVDQWGYVEVSTGSPLIFDGTACNQAFPNRGGPLFLEGDNGSRAQVSPLSADMVRILVDEDGDGAYEEATDRPWRDSGV